MSVEVKHLAIAVEFLLADFKAADAEVIGSQARFADFASLPWLPERTGLHGYGAILYEAIVQGRREWRAVPGVFARRQHDATFLGIYSTTPRARLLARPLLAPRKVKIAGWSAVMENERMRCRDRFNNGYFLTIVNDFSLAVRAGAGGAYQLIGSFFYAGEDFARGEPLKTVEAEDGAVVGEITEDATIYVVKKISDDAKKNALVDRLAEKVWDELHTSMRQRVKASKPRLRKDGSKITPAAVRAFAEAWVAKNNGRERGLKAAIQAEFGIKDVRTVNDYLDPFADLK